MPRADAMLCDGWARLAAAGLPRKRKSQEEKAEHSAGLDLSEMLHSESWKCRTLAKGAGEKEG